MTEPVTVSMPGELRRTAQETADGLGLPFSTVVAQALTGWLRARLGDAWLCEHQAEQGSFDEDELRQLAIEAGVPYLSPRRT